MLNEYINEEMGYKTNTPPQLVRIRHDLTHVKRKHKLPYVIKSAQMRGFVLITLH